MSVRPIVKRLINDDADRDWCCWSLAMRKLDRPTAGKLLTDRINRVSVTAEKLDFGALRPPRKAPANVAPASFRVDDKVGPRDIQRCHRPLTAGAAYAGARVVHGLIEP
ncbi:MULTISPECIES: hypothetical protein [unclassified Sinorhizobium]|uniref:hypothetical protein n=1 Tax=unclassified Sinorhizobium TaxID=2613772 RepID=UPI0024C35A6D|nr:MULTISPECIES: hypothetical protein [unclassified Sinorhizobium]MDK1373751.1 hypothetical protein [Sinorhizobium sp. 6-70]MDK1478748.1 hypothetical protein [Sinorhizobium sp. 6-117]